MAVSRSRNACSWASRRFGPNRTASDRAIIKSPTVFYELHISDIAPGKREAAHALFNEAILRYFGKHGIHPTLFCETEFGGPSDQIVYLIPWASLADYEQAWTAFRADPEWEAVNESANQKGTIFLRTTKTLLRELPSIMSRLDQAHSTSA